MAQPAANEQSIEYSIIVHHHPAAKKDKPTELVSSTTNMNEAMKAAEKMLASGEYHKVEVKQKYFDAKNNRQIDMTLKMLEYKAKKPMSLLMIIIITLICGAASFGLTVFLVGGKHAATEVEVSPESPADH